tara:strand:- start:3101 stop:3760 length:660 start_codon:yes stop_codon:yes gene_type:complete
MRIKFLISILSFFLFYCISSDGKNNVSFGLSYSLNSSNINFYNNFFPQNIRTESFSSYSLSLFTEIKNQKNTGIRLEISQMKKGWVESYDSDMISNEFDFINIPVLMTTYFGGRKMKINFSIGPYAEFQIKNNSNIIKDMYPSKDIFFNEFRDNSFGYGIKASGGLSLDINKSSFLLLVSYLYNFDNLIDVNQKTSMVPDISSFRTLSFSLVYLLNFKR